MKLIKEETLPTGKKRWTYKMTEEEIAEAKKQREEAEKRKQELEKRRLS